MENEKEDDIKKTATNLQLPFWSYHEMKNPYSSDARLNIT